MLKGEFFAQFLWALPWCILINVSPYCLNKIIGYIECKDCGPPTTVQYLYVFGLLFSSLFESLCDQQALHIGRRIFLHTISICNAEVFAKSLRRKDMASPADKEEGEKEEGGKKKDGSLNIASKLICPLLVFLPFLGGIHVTGIYSRSFLAAHDVSPRISASALALSPPNASYFPLLNQ